jgi:hypothetical protein
MSSYDKYVRLGDDWIVYALLTHDGRSIARSVGARGWLPFGGLLGVAEPEHHHILITHQRAPRPGPSQREAASMELALITGRDPLDDCFRIEHWVLRGDN